MRFVLDNSVAMRWLFADGSDADQAYANHVLDKLGDPERQAVAPSVWPLEVANVIARAEAKHALAESRSAQFLALLEGLAVAVDADTGQYAFNTTLQLARRFRLSAYDAAYLELALRETLPLATLDFALSQAATTTGVAFL